MAALWRGPVDDVTVARAGPGKIDMRLYLDQRLRLPMLRMLDALEAHGSLLKASVALGVSQPALTKSLRDIEEMVGAPLFTRHARGVRPTESGMIMVRSGRRILAELKRTEENLGQLSNPFGGVAAIGALPVSSAGLLPIVLQHLRRRHPGIAVRLEEGRTEELLPLLIAGQIDLIVGRFYEPPTPDGFDREELWLDPMAILARAGHPLFEKAPYNPNDLPAIELVLPAAPQRVSAEIEAIVTRMGLVAAPAFRSTSYGFIREMLLSSDAISVMPPMLMLGDINRGALRAHPLPIAAPPRSAGIITAKGRTLNGAAEAFIECLRDDISKIVEQGLASLSPSSGTASPA